MVLKGGRTGEGRVAGVQQVFLRPYGMDGVAENELLPPLAIRPHSSANARVKAVRVQLHSKVVGTPISLTGHSGHTREGTRRLCDLAENRRTEGTAVAND